eukprot:4986656-Pleurochrysis_carterae.AAC.1
MDAIDGEGRFLPRLAAASVFSPILGCVPTALTMDDICFETWYARRSMPLSRSHACSERPRGASVGKRTAMAWK